MALICVKGREAGFSKKRNQAVAQAKGQPRLTHGESELNGPSEWPFCSVLYIASSVGWAARRDVTFGRKAQLLMVQIASQAAGTIHP